MTRHEESENNKCGKCNKQVPEDRAIKCEGFCDSWFDLSCAKIKVEEYESINKLGNKIKWYCVSCNKYIADILKSKFVQNNEDWPSILNIVLSSIENNSEVTARLADRIESVEKEKMETKSTLAQLTLEVGYLREVISKSNILTKPNNVTAKDNDVALGHSAIDSVESIQHENLTTENEYVPNVNEFPTISQTQSSSKWTTYSSNRNRHRHTHNHVGRPIKPSFEKTTVTKGDNHNSVDVQRSPKADQRKQNKTIHGKALTCEGISAAVKNSWIFISRVDTSVDEKMMKDYVENLCNGAKIQCEKLKTRYDTYNSFKVGCPVSCINLVLNSESWPTGILLCKYIPPKSNKSMTFGTKANLSGMDTKSIRNQKNTATALS